MTKHRVRRAEGFAYSIDSRAWLSASARAAAQMIVFDPSNYTQKSCRLRAPSQQIQNQIKGLQNEAQMLINQAKQLEQLPATVLKTSSGLARTSSC